MKWNVWVPLVFVSLPLLGCSPVNENSENTLELCSDKIDNDANGKSDCSDDACSAFCNTSANDVIVAPARYAFGIQPTTVNMTRLNTLYNAWLTNHYEENADKSMARIKFQGGAGTDAQGRSYSRSHTVSEGIAYGMLITVAMDATPERFNRLWAYYKAHENSRGVMHWMIYLWETEAALSNGATDAELDAATGLLLAQKKWGAALGNSFYLDEATVLINTIRTYEVDEDLLLKPGDAWNSVKNPGYTASGALKSFAVATNNPEWITIAVANYSQIVQCSHPVTGIVPDWCYASDTTLVDTAFGLSSRSHDFLMEAVRMPWRLALDYYWHGSPEAKAINQRMGDYILGIAGNDASRLTQGYSWKGGGLGGTASTMFQGTYALMFSQDPTRQAQVDFLSNKMFATDVPTYYESSLQMIFSCTLAGLYPRPY